MRPRPQFALIGAILALSLVVSGCERDREAATREPISPCGEIPELTESLPDLVFPLLEGEALRLSDLRGKVVVVDFWGMLCTACVQGLDHHQRDPEMVANPQVQLIAVSIDPSAPAVRQFVASKGWTFPVAVITDEIQQSLLGSSRVVVPQARVIDTRGRLRYKLGPEQSQPETVKCLVEQLLSSE